MARVQRQRPGFDVPGRPAPAGPTIPAVVGAGRGTARVLDRVQANQDLQARLDSLRDDPRAVEAELRSSQNWVRPGEVMIVLPSGESPTTPR